MADLLPCPFCFKAAAFQRDRDPDGCMWVKVKCTGCGAETRGNRFTDPSGPCPIGYQELRDQWNQRGWDQRIAELEAEVARLRACNDASLEAMRRAVLAMAHAADEAPELYGEAYDILDAAIDAAREGAING